MLSNLKSSSVSVRIQLIDQVVNVEIGSQQGVYHHSHKTNLETLKKISTGIYELINTGRAIDDLEQKGSALYSLLFKDHKFNKHDVLQIIFDKDLLFIPAELAYNGEQFLCLQHPVSRKIASTDESHYKGEKSHRKGVAAVILENLSDDVDIREFSKRERNYIRKTLKRYLIKCAVLTAHTVNKIDLPGIFKSNEIIHYTGHHIKSEGIPLKDNKHLNSKDISKYGDLSKIQMFFLNGCQTGIFTEHDSSPEITAQLFSQGVKNIIVSTHDIENTHATKFSARFYQYLFKYNSVAKALFKTRRFLNKAQDQDMIWGQYVHYGSITDALFKIGFWNNRRYRRAVYIIITWLLLSLAALINPDFIKAFTYEKFWMSLSKADAEKYYSKALKLKQEAPIARSTDIEYLLKTSIQLSNNGYKHLLALAEFYDESDDAKKAEESYLNLKEIYPDSTDSYVNLIQLYSSQSRSKEAINELDDYLVISYNNPIIIQRYLESILSYNDIIEQLFWASLKEKEKNPDNINNLGVLAFIYRNRKDWDNLIKVAEHLYSISPANEENIDDLVDSYIAIGDFAQAMKYSRIRNRLFPGEGCSYNMGRIFYYQDQFDSAFYYFEKSLSQGITINDWTYSFLGMIYQKREIWTKAQEQFERALSINPHNLNAIAGLGNVLWHLNDYQGAIKYSEKFLQFYPADSSTLSTVAPIYYRRGDYEKSYRYYRRLNRNHPKKLNRLNFIQALAKYQDKLISEHRYQDLEFVVLEGIKLDSTNIALNFNYGLYLAYNSNWFDARHYINRSLSLVTDINRPYYSIEEMRQELYELYDFMNR